MTVDWTVGLELLAPGRRRSFLSAGVRASARSPPSSDHHHHHQGINFPDVQVPVTDCTCPRTLMQTRAPQPHFGFGVSRLYVRNTTPPPVETDQYQIRKSEL